MMVNDTFSKIKLLKYNKELFFQQKIKAVDCFKIKESTLFRQSWELKTISVCDTRLFAKETNLTGSLKIETINTCVEVIQLCQPCLFSRSGSKVKVGQNSYNNKAYHVK
jgi:hypothetical protein